MLPELISSSKRILLHFHPKPDPDSVGSALATYHALRSIGKDVTVIKGDSELSERFSFLPGYEAVVSKSYFEINPNDFDLFIIQDSGSKEMIGRTKPVEFPSGMKTMIIDHHHTNTRFAEVNLVDSSYAATAEYLYDLFAEWGIVIGKDIAACLFIGIHGDTGGFRHSNTTPRTMKIVCQLAAIYPNFTELIHQMEYNDPKEKVLFDGLALSSVKSYLEDSVAISAVSFLEMEKMGIKKEHIENNIIANLLITVKQWKIGVSLIEKAPNEVSISFRSKDGIDVSKMAVALGGGGHKPAAGAFISQPLEDVRNKVLDVIKQYYV